MTLCRVRKAKRNGLKNNWLSVFDQKGSYRCGVSNCGTCASMCHPKKEVTSTDGRDYKIQQFMNCGTTHVVYGLLCPCGLLYVGGTTHPLKKRIGEHKSSISHQKEKYSVPCNFLDVHNSSIKGLRIFGDGSH